MGTSAKQMSGLPSPALVAGAIPTTSFINSADGNSLKKKPGSSMLPGLEDPPDFGALAGLQGGLGMKQVGGSKQ